MRSSLEVFSNDNGTQMYHRVGVNEEASQKPVTLTITPYTTLIIDLGETENTKPAPLPLPYVEVKHSENIECEEVHRIVHPDNAVRVFFRVTNTSPEIETISVVERNDPLNY